MTWVEPIAVRLVSKLQQRDCQTKGDFTHSRQMLIISPARANSPMKPSRCRSLLIVLIASVALLSGPRASADIGFSASATNSVAVSNTLTYTFNFTNATGFPIQNVFLTNQLSIALATNQSGWVMVNSNTLVLPVGTLPTGAVLQTNLSVTPFFIGIRTNDPVITNIVTLVASGQTNVTTNLVTTVVIPKGDLAVSISVPTQGLLAGDVLVMTVAVTNLGPQTIQNVTLANQIPTSFKLLTPTNLITSFTNGNLTIGLGSLANGGSTNLQFRFEPTNSGAGFVLTAQVVASSLVDSNLANNTATSTNDIGAYLPATLIATNLSAQIYNPQTGLMEQTFLLSNIGSNSVPSARVIVSGLTNWLYNAAGTNAGLPFVTYNSALGTNQSVVMLLEYFIPTRVAVTNPVLTAFAVPPVNLTASTNLSLSITTFTNLSGGRWLVEFQSVPGRSYTVLYFDNLVSAWSAAQPAIIAPADRTQWIDNGPPKTSTHPSNTTFRLYRVLQNP